MQRGEAGASRAGRSQAGAWERGEARLNSLAELLTNLAMSLTVVSFALVCLYLRVPTYVYFLAFLIPFFGRGFVLQWLSGWIRREFVEIYPGPPDR